jgi:hypothetical protein
VLVKPVREPGVDPRVALGEGLGHQSEDPGAPGEQSQAREQLDPEDADEAAYDGAHRRIVAATDESAGRIRRPRWTGSTLLR